MTRARKNGTFFGLTESDNKKHFIVLGVPWDGTSSYRYGAKAGPDAIRSATSSRLYNRFTDDGIDLAARWRVCDHGNIPIARDPSKLEEFVVSALSRHNHANSPVLFLGGDHFITYPCFSVTAKKLGRPISLIYFDAHPDLYESYDGKAFSHATVVTRILESESNCTGRVTYVGIRASTSEQDARIEKLGLTVYRAEDVFKDGTDTIASSLKSLLREEPVYISIDLDCLDPAFAPGVGNPQPGGLATRQMMEILHGLRGLNVLAADIVEYCPRFDSPARITAFAAAILIKEVMGLIAKSPFVQEDSAQESGFRR